MLASVFAVLKPAVTAIVAQAAFSGWLSRLLWPAALAGALISPLRSSVVRTG
jgi:hypothetical protein